MASLGRAAVDKKTLGEKERKTHDAFQTPHFKNPRERKRKSPMLTGLRIGFSRAPLGSSRGGKTKRRKRVKLFFHSKKIRKQSTLKPKGWKTGGEKVLA